LKRLFAKLSSTKKTDNEKVSVMHCSLFTSG